MPTAPAGTATSSQRKDLAIIRELLRDGRASNVSIAAAVGLSEGSVRRRIDKLISQGRLTFTVLPDPAFLGRPVHVMFRIQSSPGATEDLIEQLAQMPEIAYVYHVTGQFDISAVGYFGSSESMRSFANDRVGTLEGVAEIRTIMVLRVAKRAHNWAVDMADHMTDNAPKAPIN